MVQEFSRGDTGVHQGGKQEFIKGGYKSSSRSGYRSSAGEGYRSLAEIVKDKRSKQGRIQEFSKGADTDAQQGRIQEFSRGGYRSSAGAHTGVQHGRVDKVKNKWSKQGRIQECSQWADVVGKKG